MELIDRQAVLDIALKYCPDDDGTCSEAGSDMRNMLDEIEALPLAEPDWIPCHKRLPNELEPVLVTVYRTDKSYNQKPYVRMGFIRSGRWYPIPQESAPFERDLSSYDGGDPVVTAWMPLPKPYKEVTK